MRKIFLLSILMFLGMIGYSQTIDSISHPLEKVFQSSFDSTICFYPYHGWDTKVERFFIGKKDDTIYYYCYSKLIKQSRKNKFGPDDSMIERLLSYYNSNSIPKPSNYKKMDIDDRFFWVFTETSKGSLWEKIQNENLWELSENTKEIDKQPPVELISHPPQYSFKLITHDKVIQLSYISPEEYPISNLYHVRNRITEVINWIDDFYKNHKVEFTLNQYQ
jgi:hypothetical protein